MIASSRSDSQSEAMQAKAGRAKIDFVDLKAQQARIRPQLDAAIKAVLDHGQYIMGPEIGVLEGRLAAFCGAKHAISCASGTDALLMIMMAKSIGPGDAVLCPGFTYTATPETIALLGASPVFCDVDEATFNVDPHTLKGALDAAVAAGLKPRAIIAVDLFGLPADYPAIQTFADEHGLFVISDSAQGFGGAIGGRKAGTFGLATATSFFPAKPLGCYGDGGAILTDDDGLAELLRSIRLHGKGDDRYDIVRIGINGRLDTLQAAILNVKLDVFPDEIVSRQQVAARYTEGLADTCVTPVVPPGYQSVWAQYTLRVAPGRRDPLIKQLAARGIPTMVYYPRSLPEQTAYRHYPVALGGVPRSMSLPLEVISLPMHPYLEVGTQDQIAAAVREELTA